MASIPVLWPEISVNAVTPAAVLRVQAASLERVTKGLLIGRVSSGEAGEQEYLNLDVYAPALELTQRIVTITCKKGSPYPATVQWEPQRLTVNSMLGPKHPQASSDAELEEILGQAFGSSRVKAILHSLIARSNELSMDTTVSGDDDGDTRLTDADEGWSGEEVEANADTVNDEPTIDDRS